MRFALLTALLSFIASPALCQTGMYDTERTLYTKEMSGGFIAHGGGWGLNFTHGRYVTAAKRRCWGIELVGMKHPKEVKSFNPYYEDARGYFFGKVNSFLILRPTFGYKTRISDKIRKSGVEVNWFWGIGPSLGLLKPVYLQILTNDRNDANIVVEKYDPEKHDVNNIFGRATWFKGLGELQLTPGAFGRFGFDFEYSGQNLGIKALQVGTSIDAYAKKVPIMAELEGVENKQFFLEFFVAVQFGKKWTR